MQNYVPPPQEQRQGDTASASSRDGASAAQAFRATPPGSPRAERAAGADFDEEAGRRRRTAGEETAETEEEEEKEADAAYQPTAVRYAAPSSSFKGKILRSLPVISVLILMTCLFCIYFSLHLLPLMENTDPGDPAAFTRGVAETAVFCSVLLLQLVCFFRSVYTPPGGVDSFTPEEEEALLLQQTREVKRTGERRECKWCLHYKPDRTHHCRICRACVLKMDHHCPWIANCVGWKNHKFFMLFIFYSAVLSIFLAATMFESVLKVLAQPVASFEHLFLLLFGETLDFFVGLVVTGFLLFHLYLIFSGMTTIEFCEKRYKWRGADTRISGSVWDRGCWINFNEAFGYNPLLWLLPIDNRPGDGISFVPNPVLGLQSPEQVVADDKEREAAAARQILH